MRHIHNKIVICAALAAIPMTAGANVSVPDGDVASNAETSLTADEPEADIQISGRIVGEDGNPLAGATVVVKGTTNGTISDTDGNFSITADESSVLVVSFNGYSPLELPVNGNTSLGVVVLKKAANEGSIPVAFRSMNEEDLIGSVSYVNVEENIESNFTTGTFDNMTSYAGGWNGSTLWGMNSDNVGYFVVVDGCPRGLSGYQNLLPSEIESITFMKGADAVALYGTRGAKGAILITTKRGKVKDGLQITGRVTTGFYVAKSLPEYVGSVEYMELYNQARLSDGQKEQFSEEDIENYDTKGNPYRYTDVDYLSSDYISKWYNRTDAGIELVGGSEKARYYGSINYYTYGDHMEVGDAKDNRTHRYSVRGNIDVKINDFISAYVNSNATFYDSKTAGNVNWWDVASKQRPNHPVNAAPLIPVDMVLTDDAKNLLSTTNNIYGGKFLAGTLEDKTTAFGDVYAAGSRTYTIRKFQFDAGMNFDLGHLLPGLSLRTILGMDFSTQYTTSFNNKYAVFIPTWGEVDGEEGIVSLKREGNDERTGYQSMEGSDDDRMISVNLMVDYKRSFGQHNVDAMILASGSQETNAGTYHSDCSAHMGFHAGYNFAHKYYLDANAALVHSIRLAPGHRNVWSPSVTAAWDLAKESFMQSASFLDKFQIEASASILNEDYDLVISDQKYYLYDGVWDKNSWGFTWCDGKNATSISPKRGENYELEMIKRKEIRLGLRSLFLNRSFGLNLNFFQNYMDGYLINTGNDYPAHMTAFIPYRNNNVVRRRGFDFEFTAHRKFGEVDLTLGVYGTHYNTERTKYEETPKHDYAKREGTAEDAIWGYKCIGFFEDQDDIDDSPKQNLGSTVMPGDLKYEDINGDGEINPDDDQVCLGKYGSYGSPTVIGLSLTAKWRSFTFFIAGSGHYGGNKLLNSQYYQMDETDKYSVIARDCWTEDNTNAKYPRISSKANKNNFVTSDFWMYSENRFTLDKVQITYELPKTIFGNSFVKGMTVYVMGQDLFMFSKNREYMELTVGYAPQTRYFGLGVKAQF